MVEMQERDFERSEAPVRMILPKLALVGGGALVGALCAAVLMSSLWRRDVQERDEQFAQAALELVMCVRQRAEYKKRAKSACCCTCDGPED